VAKAQNLEKLHKLCLFKHFQIVFVTEETHHQRTIKVLVLQFYGLKFQFNFKHGEFHDINSESEAIELPQLLELLLKLLEFSFEILSLRIFFLLIRKKNLFLKLLILFSRFYTNLVLVFISIVNLIVDQIVNQ
jgi:hypothetical protein